MPRWGTAASRLCVLGLKKIAEGPPRGDLSQFLPRRCSSKVSGSGAPDWASKGSSSAPKPEVRELNIDCLFFSFFQYLLERRSLLELNVLLDPLFLALFVLRLP